MEVVRNLSYRKANEHVLQFARVLTIFANFVIIVPICFLQRFLQGK